MATETKEQHDRRIRFHKTVRMFLDGSADRWPEDEPFERYAQVWKGSLTVCVSDSASADDTLKETYDPDGTGEFRWLGTIDLDTGDLVASSGETALGRGLPGGAS